MTMGIVTEELVRTIRDQVERHSLVLWFDPERIGEGVVAVLESEGIRVERYRGSFFELRYRVSPLIREVSPPRLVVWVPVELSATHHALVELEAAGVVMAPGQQPPIRNTRLAVVVRRAFAEKLPPDQLDQLTRQVEKGKLTLKDLDRMDESTPVDTSVPGTIFGSSDPVSVIRRFASDSGRDNELVKRDALGELEAFVRRWVGLSVVGEASPADVRHRLVQHLLKVDLVASGGEAVVDALQDDDITTLSRSARTTIEEILRGWRTDIEARRSFVEFAREMESRYRQVLGSVPPRDLVAVETFPLVDRLLCADVEAGLLRDEKPIGKIIDLIERRRKGFWASVDESILLRWDLLERITDLLDSTEALKEELATEDGDLKSLAQRYVGNDENPGWCRVDTHFRRMESLFHRVDLDLGADGGDSMERLISLARAGYAQATDALAAAFVEALRVDSFDIPAMPLQREVYRRFVEPALEAGRVAYVLVDGLRFEMGKELVSLLEDRGDVETVEITPVQGQLPSITSIGMGCLMPWADQKPQLVDTGSGVALGLGSAVLRTRAERVIFMKKVIGEGFLELKLDRLLPARKQIREKLAAARCVLVTATDELDHLCEMANTAMAHRLMGDILDQLSRAVKTLIREGFQTVVLTADHGFLLGAELDAGTKIDPPGGETVELHRRVWIGRGGKAGSGFLRFDAEAVGLGGDLELGVPVGTGGFKVAGGSMAYFHGGASPQELLLPVVVVTGRAEARPVGGGGVSWNLTLGGQSISSPFVSVQITGTKEQLFVEDLPRVRLEVLEGRKIISKVVSAVYGHHSQSESVQLELDPETGDPRPNSVVVSLSPLPGSDTVEVRLVDVEGNEVLARLKDVPVKIAGF